ncbi:MAG: hypothetical protein OHK0013_37520 [Sandaracinaceae bacterium]
MTVCSALEGWVLDATDCNDACATCFPGATETCNDVDDDCDDTTDEGVRFTFYRDADGDGRGSRASGGVEACAAPAGHSPFADDCDDTRASAYPGATETCNGLDDDCDARPDQTFACAQGSTLSCMTSCGTMGTTTCSSSCTPSATCTPPVETCNDRDDDCDGWIDEGVRTFGASVTAGPAGRRIEVLPYSGGFVAVYQSEGGIRAQRFDGGGAPVGSEAWVSTASMSDFGAAISGDSLIVVTRRSSDLAGYRYDLTPSITHVLGPVDLGAGDVSGTSRIRLAAMRGELYVVFDALLTPTGSTRSVFVLRRSLTFTGSSTRFTAFSMVTTGDDLDIATDGNALYVATVFISRSSSQLNVTRIPETATSGSDVRFVTVPTGDTTPRVPQIAVQAMGAGRALATVLYQREGSPSVRLVAVRIGSDGSMDASAPDVVVGTTALAASSPPAPADVVALGNERFGLAYLLPSATGASLRYREARVPEAGAPLLSEAETLEPITAMAGSLSLARSVPGVPNATMMGLSPAGTSTARVRVRACR